MGDHFEEALQNIARKRNGGGKTPDDLFDLAVAANRDAEERHEESVKETKANRELLEAHCVEATVRDERLEALEGWRREQARTCQKRIEDIVKKEHDTRHSAHMSAEHRATDLPGENHTGERFLTRETIVANFWILIALIATNSAVTYLIVWLLDRVKQGGTP